MSCISLVAIGVAVCCANTIDMIVRSVSCCADYCQAATERRVCQDSEERVIAEQELDTTQAVDVAEEPPYSVNPQPDCVASETSPLIDKRSH